MYKILIVDDEQYTLDGLVDLLDWNTLDILEPITANNVREAKNLLLKQSVDIILCDIEMPHGTGLELTHWIRENLTDISVILVTCHEEFAYAQEALALKVTDYIVKPVIKDQLEKVLRSTIKSIKERRFSKRTEIFRNRLWRKVLIEQPELSQKDIEKEFRSNFSLYSRNDKFAIFLIKTNANDIILADFLNKLCDCWIPIEAQCAYVIITRDQNRVQIALEKLLNTLSNEIILNYEVASEVMLDETRSALHTLLKQNTTETTEAEHIFMSQTPKIWSDLLSCQKREELFKEIRKDIIDQKPSNSRELTCCFQNFLQAVFVILDKNGIPAHELFFDNLDPIFSVIRSTDELLDRILVIADRCIKLLHNNMKKKSIEQRIAEYIKEHLSEGITRHKIANHFSLNPDYLSRLFKSTTGKTLSNYIIECRIAWAKDLLHNPVLSITEISETIGYSNYSYFARVFKKLTGMRPKEYRHYIGQDR